MPWARLNARKPFSVVAHRDTSAGPPANCKSLAFGTVSCSETLTAWSGKLTFKPV